MTGVAVVTTEAASGPTGTTINSFTSLSLDPPLILFCIHKRSRLRAALRESGTFAVNFLAGWQESLAWAFAGRNSTSQDVAYRNCEAGIPVLSHALAHLACRIVDEHPGGDHRIVVGEVIEVGAPRRQEPLIFFQGVFGVLQEEGRVHPIWDG
ncbi:flavin reductase family protein [Geodermatophilus sp. SYSU D01176]